MFRNYLKIAFRVLLNNKKHTAITVVGLALGLAASILIALYVHAEFSYDTMHAKADRIYRVESNFYEGDALTDEWATSSFGYGQAMRDHISGIADFARLALDQTEQIVGYKNEFIREKGVTYTDPSFFTIFDFELLQGNKATLLTKPNTVVISKSAALKWFHGESPLGKVISFGTKHNIQRCEVIGVVDDLPENSHAQFDYFIAMEGLPDWKKDFWYLHEVYTYVLLHPNTAPKSVEQAFPALAEQYKTEEALKNKTWGVTLTPLKDIHLNPWKQYERETKGNKITLYALLAVALIILVIAWSNYINSSIAQSFVRVKEIAIKKVHGAGKKRIIEQFLFEAFITNGIALLLSVVFIVLALSSLSFFKESNIMLLPLKHLYFWLMVLMAFVVGVLLSGFYPAFVISSFKSIEMLKGKLQSNTKKLTPLSFLVVIQLALSLFLIVGTLTVYLQVKFMQTQPLGIDISDKLVLKFPAKTEAMEQKLVSFSEALKSRADIKEVTVSGAVPGMEVAMFASNKLKSDSDSQNRLYEMLTVDFNYLEAYNVHLLAGRFFDKSYGAESHNIVVNESALKPLEIISPNEAIGKEVYVEGQQQPFKIIGVTENWHQKSLNNDYTPIMFIMNGAVSWIPPSYITIHYASNNIDHLISGIEKTWFSYFENSSFDYFFNDQFYAAQYKSDKNHSAILTLFTVLALIITCLGLYALMSHVVRRRTKEIGVRKVLGANEVKVVVLLSKQFLNLVLVAFIIMAPIAWYVMGLWLQNFTFHIGVQWWVFVVAGVSLLGVTLFTVGQQSLKAALINPVKSLRTE